MIRNTLTISFLICICFSSVIAQDFREGYVITNSGDSLTGLVDYRMRRASSKICLFKASKKSDVVKYRPEDISRYAFFNDKHFDSKELQDEKNIKTRVFAETIVEGKMSLYNANDVFFIEVDGKVYRLPRKTSALVQTEYGLKSQTNNNYIGILNFLIKDCNLDASKVKYQERDFVNIVQNYNRCKDSAGIVHKAEKKSTRFNYQIFGGFDQSKLVISGYENIFQKNNSYFIGGGVDLSSPGVYDRLFLTIEAVYLKKGYRGYYEMEANNTTDRYYYFLDMTFLKVPIGFRLNLLNNRNTPYVRLGLADYVVLKSSLAIQNEKELNNIVTVDYEEVSFNDRNSIGYWAAIGYCKDIGWSAKVFAEFRYEKTNGFLGEAIDFESSKTTNINIIVGLRF